MCPKTLFSPFRFKKTFRSQCLWVLIFALGSLMFIQRGAQASLNPPRPRLLSPSRSPVTGFPFLLQWTRSSQDFIYELQEDIQSSFSSPERANFWPSIPQENIPGRSARIYYYRVRAWSNLPEVGGIASSWSNVIQVNVLSDTGFENLLARKIYDYFIASTYANGLTRDRLLAVTGTNTENEASIAATGFYLSTLTIGVTRGWISRTAANNRARTSLQTLLNIAPQVHGFLYHFLNPDGSAATYPFREVSSIDTALLMAGVLQAGEYFSGDVKTLADQLYRRVEWNWMFDTQSNTMRQAWMPESGLGGYYNSYSEALLLDLLAIGSPTYPIPAQAFYSFHRPKGNYRGSDFIFTFGGQLFTYQYAHAWYDFRNTTDALGVNWWQNSIEATQANQRFCMDHPEQGYSSLLWGLTACDGEGNAERPYIYHAYGALPAYFQEDDGTIAPTAAGGSIALTPDSASPALKNMYANYGDNIWKTYGFVDSFNPRTGWADSYYISIDQGIMLLMLQNKRDGMIWRTFMTNLHVQRSLARTHFQGYTKPDISLENFEDRNLWTPDTTVGWWDNDGTRVYQRSSIDTLASGGLVSMQIQYAKNGLPYSFTAAHLNPTNPKTDFSGYERVSLDVYGSSHLLVKFRNQNLAEEEIATLSTTNPTGWNHLVFDFSKLQMNTANMSDILFFLEPGNDTAVGTVFFDEISLENAHPILIEDFEDNNFWTPDTTLGWWDNDGTTVYQRYQTKDPSHGGLGAMQVQFNKNGLPWSLFAGFISESNPIHNFTQRTLLSFWAKGNGRLLVKLKDRRGNETELGTGIVQESTAWQKFSFDYSSTIGIDLTNIESILFFADPGDPASSGTIYIDDMVLE